MFRIIFAIYWLSSISNYKRTVIFVKFQIPKRHLTFFFSHWNKNCKKFEITLCFLECIHLCASPQLNLVGGAQHISFCQHNPSPPRRPYFLCCSENCWEIGSSWKLLSENVIVWPFVRVFHTWCVSWSPSYAAFTKHLRALGSAVNNNKPA